MKHLISVIILFLLVGTAPSQANTLSRMLGESGLSPEDLDIMTGRAASLYTAASPRVGDRSEWKNDSSGTTGTVEILAIEGNCVTIGHLFTTKKKRQSQGLRMRRCKAADGSWKLD